MKPKIVLAAIALMLMLYSWLLAPAVRRGADQRHMLICGQHLRVLTRALLMYCQDNDDRFPPAQSWSDVLVPYVGDRSVFACPAARNRTCSYAYNAALGDLRRSDLLNPQETIALFESDLGWNATGGADLLPALPRHDENREDIVAVAEGWTTLSSRNSELGIGNTGRQLTWVPQVRRPLTSQLKDDL